MKEMNIIIVVNILADWQHKFQSYFTKALLEFLLCSLGKADF